MTRRVLSAALCAGVLLGALSPAARVAAKPPDLPLSQKDTLAPEDAQPGFVIGPSWKYSPGEVASDCTSSPGPFADGTLLGNVKVQEPITGSLLSELDVNWDSGMTGTVVANECNSDGVSPADDAEEQAILAADRFAPFTCLGRAVDSVGGFGGADTCKFFGGSTDALNAGKIAHLGSLGTICPLSALYRLRPTARQHFTSGLLFGVNPLFVLVPTDKLLDTPADHPPRRVDHPVALAVRGEPTNPPSAPSTPSVCPWLNRPVVDRHAQTIEAADLSRDVLGNLERLLEADRLMETARELTRAGYGWEALECYEMVYQLCPGSSFEDRVCQALADLFTQWSDTSEEAEPDEEGPSGEARGGCPSACPKCEKLHAAHRAAVRQQVAGLMKACRLHMEAGQQDRAAELAREAYALDPDSVTADPLVYKMLLLADQQAKRGTVSSRCRTTACDPSRSSCPACPGAVRMTAPPLPPVDPGVVRALEKVLDESAKPATMKIVVVEGTGPTEEQEEHPRGATRIEVEEVESSADAPRVGWPGMEAFLSAEVVKRLLESGSVNLPGDVCVEVGACRQGLRVFCRVPWNGSLYHLSYGPDGFDAWVTSDGRSR